MPRIAVALGVVTTIAICIGINTYRYPKVREMVATTPQLRLPAGPARTTAGSPESQAAAAPSRSAPAGTEATEATVGRASSDPKPSWRSEATEPAAPAQLPEKRAKAEQEPPKAPPTQVDPAGTKEKASGKSSRGMAGDLPDAGSPRAADDGEEQTSPAVDQEPRGEEPVVAGTWTDGNRVDEETPVPSATPSIAEPTVKYGSLASSPDAASSGSVGSRPMAPLASAETAPLRKWEMDGFGKDEVERLPPVDQVWGDIAEVAPPADGNRIAIYPTTGL